MQNKKMLPLTDRRALVVYLQDMRYRRIAFQNFRWAYNMDGIDDRWTLANRAINVDGDNSFEFYAPSTTGGLQGIVSQGISSTGASREFGLYFDSSLNGGTLAMNFGGSFNALCNAAQGFILGEKYFLSLVGNSFSLSRGAASNVIRSGAIVKGAAREPSAQTVIGALPAGASAFSAFFRGIQRDIKINGVLWPIADRNQAIQPSIPEGNNMTGTNLNPDRWVEIPK